MVFSSFRRLVENTLISGIIIKVFVYFRVIFSTKTIQTINSCLLIFMTIITFRDTNVIT